MMTGDQVATARAVARQLGLAEDGVAEVFDVAEFEHLSHQELIAAVRRAHVFARVSPAQKLLIVRALQDAGERVAMTGDGINDSPALKAADVGVAMGGNTSSEAAREVADVVLQTDDLAALAIAVERGRTTYVNVRKSIRYLLATNLSEILVVLGATLAGFSEPVTEMQLLWINLVGDVLPGLGLACEPPEPGLLHQPPHDATKHVLERNELTRLGLQGSVIAAGSLAAMGWGASRHGVGAEARTMAFGSLMTAQLLHALTARSDRQGLLSAGDDPLPPNLPLRGTLLASAAIQGVGLLIPALRGILGVVPLGPLDVAVTIAAGAAPFVVNEALKTAALPAPPKAA
jgi:Ca2+-transporting ATPase